MQINSVDDIDMLKVIAKIPKGTHRLRGFTMRAEKKLTNEREYVAAVRLTANGPVMKFSKPNIEEVVEDYTDLSFAVFHELLHILEGHLDLDRIRDRYRLPNLFEGQTTLRDLEGNEEDLSFEDRRRWKILHFVNELEIKHMEHVLLPDEFHEMNRRLYGEEVDRDIPKLPDDKRILYRGNEDFDSLIYKRLHGRVFSRNQYSPLEAFRVLDRLLPDDPPDQDDQKKKVKAGGQGSKGDPQDSDGGQGSADGDEEAEGGQGQGGGGQPDEDEQGAGGGSGEEEGEGGEDEEKEDQEEGGGDGEDEDEEIDVSENDPLDHTESGIDEDAQDEDIQDLVDALEDMAEDEDDGDDSAGADDGDDDSDMSQQDTSGGGHTLKPQVAEAKRQRSVRQPRNHEVEEEIKKSGTATDFHSKVASRVRDEVGKAIQYSVRPNYRHDHRARIGRKMGHFVPKYKQARAPNEEKIALYYDISGSQTEYIPACNEIVLHNKRHLADQSVFLFAVGVQEMKISTFSDLAQKGTVQNALSTYGTNFNDVVRHTRENDFSKIVVLTDDLSEIDHSLIDPMIQSGQLEHVLIVCTIEKDDRQKERSPGFIHGGNQGGYADEVVRIKPVTH
jgi:hypothetical protein